MIDHNRKPSPRCATAVSAVRWWTTFCPSARLTRRWTEILVALLVLSTNLVAADEHRPVKPLRESARRILADPEFRHFDHFADDAFQRGKGDAEAAGEMESSPHKEGEPDASSSENGNTSSEPAPWWRNLMNRAPQQKGSNKEGGTSRNQRLSPSGTSGSGNETSSRSQGEQQTGDGSPGSGSSTSGSSRSSNAGKSTEEANDSTTPSGQPRDDSNSQPARSGGPSTPPPKGASANDSPSSDQAQGETTRTGEADSKTKGPAPAANGNSKSMPTPKSTAERPMRTQRPSSPTQRGADGVQRPVRQSSRSARAPKPSSPTEPLWEGPSLGIGNLLGGLFHGLAYLILAVIVVAIVVLVAQALMNAWNDRQRASNLSGEVMAGPLTHDRSPGETESDVFLREALVLAQRGDYRAAIGRLVLGGMSFVERQQWIRYRRGLTVHDYLRVLRSRPEQFIGFREVVQVFEPVEYGRRPATEPLFATALAGYQLGFQAGPEAETT